MQRVGAWLAAAGLPTTIVGSNAALNDPIGWAIRQSDGTVASAVLVTDADVATVASADLDQLIDLAELRALESVLSNFTGVDKKAGPVELKSSQMADRLERRIASLRSMISLTYGIGGYGAFSVALTRTDGYSELAAE